MDNILEKESRKSRKSKKSTRVFCQEPYAEELLKMYDGYDEKYQYNLEIQNGQIIEGTLIDTTSKYILVDIGYKDMVLVDGNEKEIAAVQKMGKGIGSTIQVMIVDYKQDPFQIMGSFISLDRKDTYDNILQNSDTTIVIAKVVEWSPAGFKVEVNHDGFKIPAFMPNTLAGINKLSNEQSQELVGKDIEVMVETYQEDKGTFVVSRKKYLQTLIPQALDEIKITDDAGNPVSYSGTVTGNTKFGVFVEFKGCLTGMIHMANLNPEWISKLNSGNITPGENIDFFVKENVNGKLILTQVWRTTLWDTIAKDDIFDVPVKEFKKFGALVQLDMETVGLIHTSEIEKSKRSLKVGDKVKVKVITVQRKERKIFLAII